MKTKNLFLYAIAFMLISITFFSCDKDDDNDDTSNPNSSSTNTFTEVISPYLICANRNPGGVGFDFEYMGEKAGANNMDSPSVSNFAYDIKIRTIKGEKTDGTLGGAPFIEMYSGVKAVNYSAIDTTCVGYTAFQNLNSSNILAYTLQSDDSSFDISSVPTGGTGNPLMQQLLAEYNKLVIGIRWKETAYNTISDDELIWIIETREGRLVKFIVTDFPADPAPTSTGYIAIEWDFVD